MSDTHGNLENIRKVMEKHKDIKNVFHLGDGRSDIDLIKEEYKNKTFFRVCGNCDSGATEPVTLVETLEGKKFLLTHGHEFNVKDNLDLLLKEAKKEHADVALFGHTHKPIKKEIDGIILFNPGSLNGKTIIFRPGNIIERKDCSYGIIKIDNGNLEFEHFEI